MQAIIKSVEESQGQDTDFTSNYIGQIGDIVGHYIHPTDKRKTVFIKFSKRDVKRFYLNEIEVLTN